MNDPATQDRLIAELLEKAMDLAPAERRSFLTGATTDETIISRVLLLLDAEPDAGQLLDKPLMTTINLDMEALKQQVEDDKEPPRRTVRHFTLEEVLGEGGMGRVYLAHQNHPVKRQVALKLMRHGLSSATDKARFDAERQSLARLNHPNIAQMFEAGSTEDDKLYFAMELVRGLPITRYCDRSRLSIKARLKLFLDVLMAVQHAHQRQLLHRDLKPSNIMVAEIDKSPVVKVIDFGISLGIDEIAGQAKQKGQRAGTPGYSSPESLEPADRGITLDTRSDIYTLGIVLYELACGRRPFDAPGDSIDEVWQKISEHKALSPRDQLGQMDKAEVAGIAAARGTSQRRLSRELEGELTAVIMKAIAYDREDRYSSVSEFQNDLGNLLDHRPVNARKQDFTERANLYLQRNVGWVLTGSIMVIAVAAGLVAWSDEAHRANLEANRANREAQLAQEALAESRELSAFLVNLFTLTGKQTGRPDRMTTEELLDLGAENLSSKHSADPLTRARLQHLLGEVYTELYMLDEAEAMVSKALETRRNSLDENHPLVADSLGQLGDIYRIQMRYEEAEPILLEALKTAERSEVEDLEITAQVWSRLGILYSNQDRLDEAIAAHERALDIREIDLKGQDELALAESLSNLGLMLMSRNRAPEALPYFQQTAEIYNRLLGTGNLKTAAVTNNLATVEESIGALDEAEEHYRQAIGMWMEIDGPMAQRPVLATEALARSLGRWGRYQEGVNTAAEAVSLRRSIHGPEHPDVANALIALGVNQANAGDLDASERSLQEALAILASNLGADHPRTRAARDSLGWLAWQQGNHALAQEIHEDLLKKRLVDYGANHALTAFSQHNLALALASQNRLSQGVELMTDALVTWERLRGTEHRTTSHSLHYLGLMLWGLGQKEDAREKLDRSLQIRARLFAADHPDVIKSQIALKALEQDRPAPSVTPDH